ncbi:hypothetical protein C7212DRAFT_367268 [Tuber magnatum]|nr:hypothetical protein C7212DRAFT_367268 [Tuber magnatum]
MNIAFGISRDGGSIKDLRDPPSGFDMTVKNLCGLFVRVIDSKIYLVHQTAREFLIRGSFPGQGNWQYTLCPRDSNFIMADICISYLSQEEFEGGPLEIGMFGRVSETAVRHYVEKYGFLDYAAQHWPDHFRDSDDGGMKLFEITQQICETGSNRLLTWLQVYWLNNRRFDAFPKDWTHMMIASMLGQGMVVERLLQEGADINAQCEVYGTALNIAAIWKDEGMTERLLEGNAKAYIDGQELDILHMVCEFVVAGARADLELCFAMQKRVRELH